MEKIWYNHRTDNRYTFDKSGFGKTLSNIVAPEKTRSLFYSPIGNKRLMAWSFAPPRIEREVNGSLAGVADVNNYAVDMVISLSDEDVPDQYFSYKYSARDIQLCLRIADELILSDKPIAIILPKGDNEAKRIYAEALLKLTLHMFMRDYANNIGFISFMTNSTLSNWLKDAEKNLGIKINLIFKYGEILEDTDIVSIELDDRFISKRIETRYLQVLESYITETGADCEDLFDKILRFTRKTKANDVEINGAKENFAYYGAAYSYITECPESEKALNLFLDAYKTAGYPTPQSRQVWRDTSDAFNKYARLTPENPKVFEWFYSAYKNINDKYKPNILKILHDYSNTQNDEYFTELIDVALSSGEDCGEIFCILASSFWQDSVEKVKTLDEKDEHKAEMILSAFSDNIYKEVFFWLNLAYNLTQERTTCPRVLKVHLENMQQSVNTVLVRWIIGETGEITDKVVVNQAYVNKIFKETANISDIFESCPEVSSIILEKFFADTPIDEIEWGMFSPLYNKVINNDLVLQWANETKFDLYKPQKDYDAEQKRMQIERELAEKKEQDEINKRFAEEQERLAKEQKAAEIAKQKTALDNERTQKSNTDNYKKLAKSYTETQLQYCIDEQIKFLAQTGGGYVNETEKIQHTYRIDSQKKKFRNKIFILGSAFIVFSLVSIGIFYGISNVFAVLFGGGFKEYFAKIWIVWILGYLIFITWLICVSNWESKIADKNDLENKKSGRYRYSEMVLKNMLSATTLACIFVLLSNLIAWATVCLL